MSRELINLVTGIEKDRSALGWDLAPVLYALVSTADLIAQEPQLEFALADRMERLTAVEQEELPDQPLEEFLPTIQWPAEVLGAAIALERWLVPDSVSDASDLAEWNAQAAKEDVRIVVAVLRDGSQACAMRLRQHDADDSVLVGPDLVPGLIESLAATFRD